MMKLDRRLLANFDWLLVCLALALTVMGILNIYSATRPIYGTERPAFYAKQIYWLLIGMGAMIMAASIDYKLIKKYSNILFGITVAMLIFVYIAGKTGMGAQRWISIGPVNIQPSEVFKLVFLIVVANYMSRISGTMDTRSLLVCFFTYGFIPVLLVLRQPDLGTALVILILFVAMVLTKGVVMRFLTLAVIIAMISIPFIGSIVWDQLKPYQKKRIIVYFNSDSDPAGLSYHVQQSKVAVGSGGMLGKGYQKGTQAAFRFLPEKHTDFVFSVYAEEWGFMGSMFLFILYMSLLFRALHTAAKAKDEFGRYLALGIAYMITLYCFVNIGMTMGLAPVVGIPLPFMSYGGTALVMNFIAIGLLINIRARRFELFY